MSWAEMQSDWAAISGHIQSRWGRMTDDDLHFARGGREKLIDRIQQRYGIEKSSVEQQVDGWLNSFQ